MTDGNQFYAKPFHDWFHAIMRAENPMESRHASHMRALLDWWRISGRKCPNPRIS